MQDDDAEPWPCPHCGYDLRGTINEWREEVVQCPECGNTCNPEAVFDGILRRRGETGRRFYLRNYAPAILSLVLLCCGLLAHQFLGRSFAAPIFLMSLASFPVRCLAMTVFIFRTDGIRCGPWQCLRHTGSTLFMNLIGLMILGPIAFLIVALIAAIWL